MILKQNQNNVSVHAKRFMSPIMLVHILGELPVTIDFSPFDRSPGDHSITIVANSTLGEVANFTNTFYVPGAL